MKTLYDVLGVDEDADEKAIKKAYRNKVKTCHPDTGGDPALFQEVQRAYDILSDPERRARYDETGHMGDVEPERNRAAEIVASIFEKIIESKMPPTEDYVEAIRDVIRNSLSEVKKAQARNVDSRDRFNVLIKKFKNKKSPKDNMFKAALQAKLRNCDEKEGGMNKAKAELEQALKILEDYEFEVDRDPEISEMTRGPMFTFRARRDTYGGSSTT